MTTFARLACLVACALAATAATAAAEPRQPEHANHRELPGDAPAIDRSLWQLPGDWTDQGGASVSFASLAGSPTLLALFYGSCDSVCPIVVRDLQKLEGMLPEADRARTRFVLVTIDRSVDTPERLRDYAAQRGLDPARWKLLHGSPEQVRVLANLLGVKYRPSANGQYSHTIRITLLDRSGVVAAHFDGLERPLEPIAAKTSALLAE